MLSSWSLSLLDIDLLMHGDHNLSKNLEIIEKFAIMLAASASKMCIFGGVKAYPLRFPVNAAFEDWLSALSFFSRTMTAIVVVFL